VYEASAAALLDLIRRESGAAETLLVVGHDPAIPGLASHWRRPPRMTGWAPDPARCPPGCLTACGPSSRPQRSRCSAAPGAGMALARARRGWLASSPPATCPAAPHPGLKITDQRVIRGNGALPLIEASLIDLTDVWPVPRAVL
jgi:hypothetical protein